MGEIMADKIDVAAPMSSEPRWMITFHDGDAFRIKVWDNPFHAQQHAHQLVQDGYAPTIWADTTEGFDDFCRDLVNAAI